MKSLIIIFTLTFTSSVFAGVTCKGKEKVFYFNMPIILGSKIFNDQVEICKDKKKLMGDLSVPKRFTAKLENIKIKGDQLSFSITADEGRGKFQVFYTGTLKENNKYFLGIAKLKDKKILGPFIGLNSKEKLKFEVIQ